MLVGFGQIDGACMQSFAGNRIFDLQLRPPTENRREVRLASDRSMLNNDERGGEVFGQSMRTLKDCDSGIAFMRRAPGRRTGRSR
jgi:hypothetical protein